MSEFDKMVEIGARVLSGLPGKAFGPGPWENEPGRVEWRHVGMPCLLRRNRLGVWCGYAGVAPGHPLHGNDCYEDIDIEAHGGLTYAAPCDGLEGTGICHVPLPGENGNVWWFGFDCAHGGDLAPAIHSRFDGETYRTMNYALHETEKLAEQLAEWPRDAEGKVTG